MPQHLRSAATRRLPWLLCFALLLPLAQQFAYAHALTHVGSAASREPLDDKRNAASALCDACLAAAPVVGGALPAVAATVPPGHATASIAGPWRVSVAPFACPSPYRSRAPPIPAC
ncbi:MAG: hypothetical protein ABIX12_15695 [Rubrivivax sp.]